MSASCIIAVMSLTEDIKGKALELGFDLAGITDCSRIDAEQVELLDNWLRSGYAGQMGYMEPNFDKRIEPGRLLEGGRSVICLGLSYKPVQMGARSEPTAPAGRIANYARYEDYHAFMKKLLRELTDLVSSSVGGDIRFKICVDSAPLAERALAARAGLGFIGKNHMLINPELGPQIFLGEIITTLKLAADEPNKGICSGCNKCIEACPTGALRGDGQFDAGKCISYLTIEHKGEIPADLARKTGDRLFGCDECVLACSYQQKGPACKNEVFKFHDERAKVGLSDVLALSRESFEAKFGDSVIKRLGVERFKRNARICLANITAKTD
ncbi:MAG TPA: tRNA epoxyqueuosine(34) reductase QueG [Sedimentisphaerales bacterium]|nr:tRNA epoxyqueuosine(34) reductase QueG [Sedimentisphaerales bacterium]